MNKDLRPLIKEYLAAEGICENAERKVRCLWHEDEHPSMTFNGETFRYHCWVCGEEHDIYDFYSAIHSIPLSRMPEIKKALCEMLGLSSAADAVSAKNAGAKEPVCLTEDTYRSVYSDARLDEFGRYTFSVPRAEVECVFPFRDTRGLVRYVEVRYCGKNFEDGKKKVISVWYDGKVIRARGCPVGLFNADKLAAAPSGTKVLIHEGPKCAVLGEAHLPAFLHTAFNGGGKKYQKVDLSLLEGKEVYIYPDDDKDAKVGLATAFGLARRLKDEYWVTAYVARPLPEARALKPSGADIAEALQVLSPDALTQHILTEHIYEEDAQSQGSREAVLDEEDFAVRRFIADSYDTRYKESDQARIARYIFEKLIKPGLAERDIKRFPADEAGQAEAASYYLLGHIRWCKELGWLVYDSCKGMFRADHGERTVWLILDRLADARQSGDFYEYAKSARGIKAVMAYLQYEDQVYCVAADFDKDDYLLNCLGETYDLRSGKHWASMPVDMHSKTTRYVPAEGTCDLFTNFLKQITLNDRELQAWLLRWAGYCLTGDVKAGYFCNWYGTGGNGKGVLLRVLAAIMGDYAAALSPKAVVLQAGEAEGRFEYTALPGARLAYVDDTPNGRLAEGRKE